MLHGTFRDIKTLGEGLDEAAEAATPGSAKNEKRRKSLGKHEHQPLSDGDEQETEYLEEEGGHIEPWRKALFGFGNFSRYTVLGVQAYFLNAFLLEVANIDAVWVGNIQLVKQIYDAITDPMVGRLSDRTITRWGRRKPFVILFALPAGILWVMQWLSPGFVSENDWYAIVYYGLVLILFSSANTLVSVPYNAMVPDIATDYHDRTTVVLLQEVFGLSAVILFSFVQAFVVEAFVDPETDQVDYEKGYTVAALITFLPVVVPMIVSVIFLKEPPVDLDPAEDTAGKNFFVRVGLWFWFFLKSLLKAMIFFEFMLVVVLFVACMLSVYLFVSNFVLYIKYVLHAEDQTQWLLLCTQVFATVSFFFWAFLSRKAGKKVTFLVGSVLWGGCSIIMIFLTSSDIAIFYPVCIVRAFGSGVGYLIPLAMLPDIIEIDRVKNKLAREGVLYSLMVLIQKTGVGLGISFSNYLLQWAGYETPDSETMNEQLENYQPDSVITTFKLLTCVIPVICLVIACVAIYFIPVSRRHLDKLNQQMAEEERLAKEVDATLEDTSDVYEQDLSKAEAFQ